MPRKSSKRSDRPPSNEGVSPVDRLQAAEAKDVLERLLAAHPELKKEAEAHALEKAGAVAFESTAELLAMDLQDLDLDELGSRAGNHGVEYVDPGEAGWEACQEVLDPLIAELDRQLELGLEADAFETLKGIVLGLYLARKDQGAGCLAWAPDFPEQSAGEAVTHWWKAAQREPRTKGDRRKSFVAPLLEFIAKHVPEWKGSLERVVGTLGTPPR